VLRSQVIETEGFLSGYEVVIDKGLINFAWPALRKIRRSAKVIVSSGYSEAETMKLFGGQSVSGFIQKPFTSIALAEKVKSAEQHSRNQSRTAGLRDLAIEGLREWPHAATKPSTSKEGGLQPARGFSPALGCPKTCARRDDSDG